MKSKRLSVPSKPNNRDIDWAKQNKMLRELRRKAIGKPVKNVWWSI